MEKEPLEKKHVVLQFLMMLISILAFLVLAFFAGEIVWIQDFQYFVVLISGIFATFIGVIALLRYYTQRKSLAFLFLGIGFLAVGLLDVLQIVIDVSEFRNLFFYRPGEIYPFSSILSRGFLSLLLFLGWLLSKNREERNDNKKEKFIIMMVLGAFLVFSGIIVYLVISNILLESLWVVIVGTVTVLLLVISFIGFMFRQEWRYDNFDFWLIFCLSFLVLSQIFFLPFLNIEYYNMVNLSIWAKFFAYVALLIGFLNSIYEMYQKELEFQKVLEEKNRLLDLTKKKVEEAYLVIRKEKWELIGKNKYPKKSSRADSKK